ncbi:MLXPL protein, partial [Casuarius casuarius]|nr:MLXPL protein [Casuarius casuarius]
MEGKYWKRHVQAVTREYHKWRMYSCTQGMPNAQQGPVPSGEAEGSCPMELDPLHDLEMLIADLADTIFYSRNPYGGPNPRSLGEWGSAPSLCLLEAPWQSPAVPDSMPPCSSPGQRRHDPAHPWPAAPQLW